MMKTFVSNSLIAALSFVLATSTRLSAQIANGSFESGLDGWGHAGYVEIQSAPPYQATDGSKLVSFNAGNLDPVGFVETVVDVIPGRHYRLEFDVGNFSYNSSHQRMRVKAEDLFAVQGRASYVDDIIDIAGPGGGATAWVAASYDFTPLTTRQKFTFTDWSLVTNSVDLLLDHVRLTEIPDPALVLNGGFETGLAGWRASGNVTTFSTPPYLASEGSKLAVFNSGNSAPNGVLEQEIAVAPGQLYRLSFDAGNLSYNTLHQKIKVQVQFRSFGFLYSMAEGIVDITGAGGGSTAWVSPTFDFHAIFGTAVIRFTDVSPATGSVDLVLDRVKVVPIEPTSTTIVNGSFESGFDGWSLSSADGGLAVKSAAPYTPTDGTKLAAFNTLNTPNFESISQTIKTVPGKVYDLYFDAGNLSYNPQSQQIRVLIDAGNYRIENTVITIPSATTVGWINWLKNQHFQFTAISTATTFTFIDASEATNGVDLVLDKVRLTP